MAGPPTITENTATPLSSDELAADRAASAQTTDSLDKPRTGDTALPASESHMAEDPDDARGATDIEGDMTLLPPG